MVHKERNMFELKNGSVNKQNAKTDLILFYLRNVLIADS